MEDTAIIVSYMDKIAIVPITVAEQIEEPEPEIEIEPALVIEPERSSGTEPITIYNTIGTCLKGIICQ